jgi:hypothetical protein
MSQFPPPGTSLPPDQSVNPTTVPAFPPLAPLAAAPVAPPLSSAPAPSSTISLVTSLEAAPGSVLAWATKPGQRTTEGLASILAVPITAVVSFLLTFLIAWNLVGSGQTTTIISTVVPGLASAAASYAVRGYAAGRAALKAEAIRLHLPPP